MTNNCQKSYAKLHQEGIEIALQWLQGSNPALWFDFLTRILPKMSEVEGCKQKVEDNEKRIAQLDTEIEKATKVVSGRESIIGLSGQKQWLANLFEYLLKPGLASVPIVTLFAITGVTSILNPFVNPQQRWGVPFLLLSSVSFVLLTSAGIIKIVHRLSRQHWQYQFWGLTVRSWFVIGCSVFGLIEGLGGGAFASTLIDNATAAANELRDTPLPLLDFWGKAKITAIMSLFAYVNIFFSVAKGFEIRVLQPHRVKRNQASSKLETAKDERQRLVEENKELAIRIEQLKQEVAFAVPLEERQRDIRNLSNQITLGQEFNGKHPGTYAGKPSINGSLTTNNGHSNLKAMDEVNLVSGEKFSEPSDDN